ncbi:hypothetical protein BDZ90DRAFT_281922 [Jaminaea rosea]|uniref:Uncharacterized protein n=1 Tax=Jaminaea rosea TaxID=1569628 RepID=A0A316UI94_9BASI|nr:hypothetical protein BDZ90DRAFT_281922 [Jaminaea rosea]PWN24940.1 hypothetical protein BDZ90DRAFT_281922 [Jaminaea rosea]
MFGSRSSSSSSSSSEPSSSSSTTPSSPPSSDAGAPASAGLGSMSSLSPECTPLKHKYDACFNAWFQDYLGVPTSSSTSAAGGAAEPAAKPRRRGFFGGGGGGDSESIATTGGAERDAVAREGKRNELEEKCGAMFREYQACVKKALKEKDLLPLLSQAREYNPFPFPAQSSGGKASSEDHGNSPFPFAAASKEERMDWERKEGW